MSTKGRKGIPAMRNSLISCLVCCLPANMVFCTARPRNNRWSNNTARSRTSSSGASTMGVAAY
jgi:hypothetical protein